MAVALRQECTKSLRKQAWKYLLPRSEGCAQPVLHKQGVDDCTQWSKSHFVFNHIAYQRTIQAIACLRQKFVPVMPALEWTFLLYVGEVVVPFEFSNARDPLRSHRQEREQAKRSHDYRAYSCRLRGSSFLRRWRRLSLKQVDSGVNRCRHNARQVIRICEECEDVGKREGNPVRELEARRHPQDRDDRVRCLFSTGNSVSIAECKKNLSEGIAKESKA